MSSAPPGGELWFRTSAQVTRRARQWDLTSQSDGICFQRRSEPSASLARLPSASPPLSVTVTRKRPENNDYELLNQ